MSLTECAHCGHGHRCHLENKNTPELYEEIARLMEIAEQRRQLNEALTGPLSWAEYHARKCIAAEYATELQAKVRVLTDLIDDDLIDGGEPDASWNEAMLAARDDCLALMKGIK